MQDNWPLSIQIPTNQVRHKTIYMKKLMTYGYGVFLFAGERVLTFDRKGLCIS